MTRVRRTKNGTRRALPMRLDALAAAGKLPALLEALPDERHRKLLFLRHALGLSWPAIRNSGCELYYSERQLYRLYAQALAQAGALLEAGHEG